MNGQNGYSPFSYQIFPPEYFEKKAVRRTALFTGALILIYIGATFLVSSMVQLFTRFFVYNFSFNQTSAEIFDQIIFMVTYILSMVIPFGIYALMVKIPLKVAFPLKAPRASLAIPAVPIALGTSVIGILSASALMIFFAFFGLSYDVTPVAVPYTPVAQVLYLISISVLPAIFEELAFRGVLMQSLRRHGDAFALIVSAMVFSLFHGNFLQLPNTFLLGIVIGFFVLRTDSLVTGMLMHFFNNFIVTVVDMFLLSNASEAESGLITLALLGIYVVIGVLAFIYVTHKHRGVFSLFPAYTYLNDRQKLGAFFSQPLMIVAVVLMLLMCLSFFVI